MELRYYLKLFFKNKTFFYTNSFEFAFKLLKDNTEVTGFWSGAEKFRVHRFVNWPKTVWTKKKITDNPIQTSIFNRCKKSQLFKNLNLYYSNEEVNNPNQRLQSLKGIST